MYSGSASTSIAKQDVLLAQMVQKHGVAQWNSTQKASRCEPSTSRPHYNPEESLRMRRLREGSCDGVNHEPNEEMRAHAY